MIHSKAEVRRALAAVLVSAILALAISTVSHIHGITDRDNAHNAVDLSLQNQMWSGLALAGEGSALPAPVALGSPLLLQPQSNRVAMFRVPATRGPPGFHQ